MINYVLYILIFQLLFLIAYDLLHKKDTFFSLNRLYLLVTSALSFVLPFIKIKSIQETIPKEYVVNLPAVIIGQQPTSNQIVTASENTTQITNQFSLYSFETIDWWLLLYAIGITIMLLKFIKKTVRLHQLRRKSPCTKISDYKVFTIPHCKDAFSFFNAIYLGDQLSTQEKEQITIHEIVHLREKHSFDLLWFEFLKVFCWFNPLVYVYQSRIDTLHEFVADAKSVDVLGKRKYYEQLLHTTFETEDIDFINQFFNHSLLKKRITMLQKSKSKTIRKFKYLFIIPIIGVMLVASSFSNKSSNNASFQKETISKPLEAISKDVLKINDPVHTPDIIVTEEKNTLQKNIYKEQRNIDSTPISKTIKNQSKTVIDTTKREILFAEIEKSPTTETCKGIADLKKQKECFSKEVHQYVHTNFNIDAIKPYAQSGINRIYVRFNIDQTGTITNIQARGSAPELEQEAKRVIKSIPQMLPGEHNGEKVNVLYSLPIIVTIEEEDSLPNEKVSTKKENNTEENLVLTKKLSKNPENNVELGYYLITNIFKRKSYLTRSMEKLNKIGLDAKYFKSPKDGYFYMYLGRYDQLEDAKKMLFSKVNSTYEGDLYILEIK